MDIVKDFCIACFFTCLVCYGGFSTEFSVLARNFYSTDRAIVSNDCGRACSLFGIGFLEIFDAGTYFCCLPLPKGFAVS